MARFDTAVESRDPLIEPPPIASVTELAHMAEAHFGVVGELTPLGSERDLNFRLSSASDGELVLKLHNPADTESVVDMQARALAHIEKVDPGLPVSRVIPTRDGAPWAGVTTADGRRCFLRLFAVLPGHHATAAELDAHALFEWGRSLARLGRALRGFFHPAAAYKIQWDIRHTPELRSMLGRVPDGDHALVGTVLDRFDANVAPHLPALRAQVIHNDMGPGNVLVDEHGLISGITDFGDMTHTALVCDLAVSLADLIDGHPESLDMASLVIDGYQSVTPLERTEARLLCDLVAARCATAVVITAWRSQLHPDNLSSTGAHPVAGPLALLRLLEEEGFDKASLRLREAAERPASELALARRRPGDALLAARRAVLGGLELSYDPPLHLVRGDGVWLIDAEGRRYLDAYNNVPVAGHSHPAVAEAAFAQARRLAVNTRYLHEAPVELAERLLESAGAGLDRVLFVSSGSEANDVAWRIARFVTGAKGAVVTRFAYHGVTEATTSLSPEGWPVGYEPANVRLAPAPDGYRGAHRREDPSWQERYGADAGTAIDEVVESGAGLAAVYVDTAFTSDGVLGPVPDYVRLAALATRAAGGLFVADEVQAGYGRTGEHMWSFSAAGMRPDFVTLGKPMGNGFPVAAVLTRSEIVDDFIEKTGYFSTFGGNTVACAAALALLSVVEEDRLTEHAHEVGKYLKSLLDEVAKRHRVIGDVRSWGLLAGVDLVDDRDTRAPATTTAREVVNAMMSRGILVGSTGPHGNVVKIRPPLVFDRSHADLLAETLDAVLDRHRA